MRQLLAIISLCFSFVSFGQEVKLGTPIGHSSYITQMEFVQNDELILTVSNDNTAKVWDVETQKVLHSFEDHDGKITHSKVYNDEFLVTYSFNREYNSNYGYDSTANIYSIKKGENLLSLNLRMIQMNSLNAIKVDSNNKRLAFLSMDSSIYVVSLMNKDTVTVLPLQNLNVSSFYYSEDGQFIYTSGETIIKWNVEKGLKLAESERLNSEIDNINFGNIKVPISIRSDSKFYFLDRTTLSVINSFEDPKNDQIVFGGKGKYFLTHSSDGFIKLWSFENYEFRKLTKLNYDFQNLFFDGSEKYVCVHLKNPINKLRFKNVFIWNTKNGEKALEEQHASDTKSPVFTKNSSGIFINNSKWELTPSRKDPGFNFDINDRLFVSLAIGENENTVANSDYRDFWVRTEDNKKLYFKGGEYSSYLSIHDNYFVSIGKKKQNDTKGTKKEIEFNQYWGINNGLPLKDVGHSSYYLPEFNRIVEYYNSYDEVKVKIFNEKKDSMLNEFSIKAKWNEVNPTLNYETSELVFSAKNKLYVVNCSDASLKFEANHSIGYSQCIQISSDKKFIAIGLRRGVVDLFDFNTGEKLKSLSGYQGGVQDLQFSSDCSKLAITGFINADIYDLKSEKFIFQQKVGKKDRIFYEDILSQVLVSPDDKIVAICNSDKHLAKIYSIPDNRLLYSVEHNGSWGTNNGNRMLFSSDSKSLITVAKSSSILIHNALTGELMQTLEGHKSDITDIQFRGEDTLVTCAADLSLRFWNMKTGNLLITHRYIHNNLNNWFHIHPSGLFDASPEAMELMYWIKGVEIIQFDQLKEQYWVPGLWEMVMNGEALPAVMDIQSIKLEPIVEIGELENGKLPILLTRRGGGYGEVSVYINGKQKEVDISNNVSDKTDSTQLIYYDLKENDVLVAGENEIIVKTKSENGSIQSRGDLISTYVDKAIVDPHFYGVYIGVGAYSNKRINLKYSVSDAKTMSYSMKLGAEKLFPEKTHIYTLVSQIDNDVTKSSIREVFDEIKKKAQPEDILMVYLSGHGVNWGGYNGDFYYLTSDATSASATDYDDQTMRMNNSVSSSEFMFWINEIKANKQVMIIDACGSGKAVDNLIAPRGVDDSRIKALDRMKNRTGMYIISGCAADAVSYEASVYGQGLLTYSILEAMKGASLKADGRIDVSKLMSYSQERVPVLAQGLGGIQQPQLFAPKGGSFDIGILKDEDKKAIPLANPKMIFVRSFLFNRDEDEDNLDLSGLLDEQLAIISSKGAGSNIVYFDAKKYPNACKISGGYTIEGDKITVSLKIRCGEGLKKFALEANSKEELVKKIVELVEGFE